jgi:phosphoribosylformimino-5-aminoimidazole carboxamide ribotide isomerase
MLIIPAIDLKNGQCVRLKQGRMEDATVFGDDPGAMAKHWKNQGARRLHIVDLDGAFAGKLVNQAAIESIIKACPHLPLQLGGGIRTLQTLEQIFALGVNYAIIGSQAIKQPDFVAAACKAFPERIIIGLDAKDGQVAIHGWAEVLADSSVIDWAQRFEQMGVISIIYTDIGRDGMLQGLNIEATHALARATRLPIIASGGLSQLADIEALAADAPANILGTIAGRALYENKFSLEQAQMIADQLSIV